MQPRDVYEIWTPDMSAVYVGISKCYKKRFYQHSRPRSRLHDIISNGAQVKCVASKIDEKLAARIERKLISRYRSRSTIECLNIADGGQMGSSGSSKRRYRTFKVPHTVITFKQVVRENFEQWGFSGDYNNAIKRNRWLGEFSGKPRIKVSQIKNGAWSRYGIIELRRCSVKHDLGHIAHTLRVWGIKVIEDEPLPKYKGEYNRWDQQRVWSDKENIGDMFDTYRSEPCETGEHGLKNQEMEGWDEIERLAKRLIKVKYVLDHTDIENYIERMQGIAKLANIMGLRLKSLLKDMMSRCEIPVFENVKRIDVLKLCFGNKWWVMEIAAKANIHSWQSRRYWKINQLAQIIRDFDGEHTENYYGEEMLSDGIVAMGWGVGDKILTLGGAHRNGIELTMYYYPRVKRGAFVNSLMFCSRLKKSYEGEWDSY